MNQPQLPVNNPHPDIAVNVRLANIRPDDVAEVSDVPDAKTSGEKLGWDDAKKRAELDNYTQK
ncbi:MAG TPA: hypothetical protein VFF39_02055, partial [Verrucomicrobiae bacterium]|nr:hypothetical protein [Verrucomicrobiae bacterium]